MSVPSLDRSAIKREGRLGPRAFSQGLALAPAHTQDGRWLRLECLHGSRVVQGLYVSDWLQQLLDQYRLFSDLLQRCFDSCIAHVSDVFIV